MSRLSEMHGERVPVEWYDELQDFYAGHMRHRDEGVLEDWLAAFDEDAGTLTNVFAGQARHGRAALGYAVRELDSRFTEAGLHRKHRLSTLVALRQPDGTVRTRYYALVVTTKAGEHTRVHSTSVAVDVLVRSEEGAWSISSRQVTRDDLPAAPAPAAG